MSTSAAPGQKGRLPAGRRDRRPALAALALLLVLVGALGSALVAFRSGSRIDVLVASEQISVGQRVEASNFSTIRVAADGGAVVDAAAIGNFVGTYATSTIPEGAIVHSGMFRTEDVLPRNGVEVGVVVDIDRRTTERPTEMDVVRLYFVTSGNAQSSAAYAPGEVVVEAARVLRVGSGGGSGQTSLTVLVEDDIAGELANLAASGSVAITLLSRDATPDIDLDD